MTRTQFLIATVTALLAVGSTRAHADPAADRAAVADSIVKLASGAEALAKTAKASDNKSVRKKLAAQATELGDDLAALAKRARKDVTVKQLVKDTMDADNEALALIDLADDADDKEERKSLRAQATVIEQGVLAARKALDALATAEDDKKPAPPAPIKPAMFKQLSAATEAANTDAEKVAVIRGAAANGFTCSQVGALMDLINTEAPKVDAATLLWTHLVDPQNSFQIFAKLELAGSKAELHRRVGK